jgi:hypothetical protein
MFILQKLYLGVNAKLKAAMKVAEAIISRRDSRQMF